MTRWARQLGGILAVAFIIGTTSVAYGWWDPGSLVGLGQPVTAGVAGAAQPDTVNAAEATAEGKALYMSSCATCHGPDGLGSEKGPALAAAGPAAWDFYLRTGRMPLRDPSQPFAPAPPAYSESQIQALIAYGRQLGTGADIPTMVSDAQIDVGRQIFVNTCAACHGVAASGAAIGPNAFAPSLLGVDPDVIMDAPLVGPGTMPQFDLNDGQLSAVASYITYLSDSPPPGGLDLRGFGPVAEGLVALMIGLLIVLVVVRWIGTADAPEPTEEGHDSD